MATDQQIRDDLAGSSGAGVSRVLVMGVKSLTEWPVDAFFVDDLGNDNETVGWISGHLLGVVRSEVRHDEGSVRGNLYHLAKVQAVRVDVTVVDEGMRMKALRSVTIDFGPQNSLTVDAGSFRNEYFRSRADEFISTLIVRLGRLQAETPPA